MASASATPRKRHALSCSPGCRATTTRRRGAELRPGPALAGRARARPSRCRPPARPRARRRDRHRHGRRGARARAPAATSTRSTRARHARRAARAARAPTRCWRRRSSRGSGEAEALPFADASFDALTFTYLLRYVEDPAATLRELARVVKPGGRVGMVEFGVPRGACCARVAGPHARLHARCSAACCRATGTRSAASSARASRASTRASRCRRSSRCGSGPG